MHKVLQQKTFQARHMKHFGIPKLWYPTAKADFYSLCENCFIAWWKLHNVLWNYLLHYKAKEKYRGVFEIQKSGDKTSSGEIGLDIRTHASPKVGQDQVSGGVSVLCWQMPHPLHMFYGNLVQLGKSQIR